MEVADGKRGKHMYSYSEAVLNFEESVLRGECPSWDALYTLRDHKELLPPEIAAKVYEIVPGDPNPKVDPPPLNYRNAVRLLMELKRFLE